MTVNIVSQSTLSCNPEPGYFQLPIRLLELIPQCGPEGFTVYVMLASCADSSGQASPSLRTFQQTLGFSRSRLLRALERLEHAGMIQRQRRRASHGGADTTVYTLSIPSGDESQRGAL